MQFTMPRSFAGCLVCWVFVASKWVLTGLLRLAGEHLGGYDEIPEHRSHQLLQRCSSLKNRWFFLSMGTPSHHASFFQPWNGLMTWMLGGTGYPNFGKPPIGQLFHVKFPSPVSSLVPAALQFQADVEDAHERQKQAINSFKEGPHELRVSYATQAARIMIAFMTRRLAILSCSSE